MPAKLHTNEQRQADTSSTQHIISPTRPQQTMQHEPIAHAYQQLFGSQLQTSSPSQMLSLQSSIGNQAVQRLLAPTTPRDTELTQRQENNTGLPDTLKAGIESLSGLSMDDVHVHYNSSKPAEVHALAYTQGADIHMGPGQERHLAHEAWHVVQQKEGRVKPTLQAKGVKVNDDQGLEREADTVGRRATQTYTTPYTTVSAPSILCSSEKSSIIQRIKVGDYETRVTKTEKGRARIDAFVSTGQGGSIGHIELIFDTKTKFCCCVSPNTSEAAMLENMLVEEGYRGKGISYLLIAAVAEKAREMGFSNIKCLNASTGLSYATLQKAGFNMELLLQLKTGTRHKQLRSQAPEAAIAAETKDTSANITLDELHPEAEIAAKANDTPVDTVYRTALTKALEKLNPASANLIELK